jgi:hypothetical protein
MPFQVGDAAMLRVTRVSRAGGMPRTLDEGFVGTVCELTPSGTRYWVQLENDVRLRLLRESSLKRANRPGPPCPS